MNRSTTTGRERCTVKTAARQVAGKVSKPNISTRDATLKRAIIITTSLTVKELENGVVWLHYGLSWLTNNLSTVACDPVRRNMDCRRCLIVIDRIVLS